jgi:hypothetical protein
LSSGAIARRAFQKEFGVRTADVVGIESQGVREAVLLGEAIAELSYARSEKR